MAEVARSLGSQQEALCTHAERSAALRRTGRQQDRRREMFPTVVEQVPFSASRLVSGAGRG